MILVSSYGEGYSFFMYFFHLVNVVGFGISPLFVASHLKRREFFFST